MHQSLQLNNKLPYYICEAVERFSKHISRYIGESQESGLPRGPFLIRGFGSSSIA